jgi:hypothetical protein
LTLSCSVSPFNSSFKRTAAGLSLTGALTATGPATITGAFTAGQTIDGGQSFYDAGPGGCAYDGGPCWDAGARAPVSDAGIPTPVGRTSLVGGLLTVDPVGTPGAAGNGTVTTLRTIDSAGHSVVVAELEALGTSVVHGAHVGGLIVRCVTGGAAPVECARLTSALGLEVGGFVGTSNGIGATTPTSPRFLLQNTTAAAAGAKLQNTPAVALGGSAWDDDDGVCRWVEFGLQGAMASGNAPGVSLSLLRRVSTTTCAQFPMLSASTTWSAWTAASIGSVSSVYASGGGTFTGDVSAASFNSAATTTTINGGSASTGITATNGDLAGSGDLTFAGGRSACFTSSISDIPADGSKTAGTGSTMPAAGSLLGLGVYAYAGTDLTAGTITCALTLDGPAISGHDVQFVAADEIPGAKKANTVPQNEHPFSAAAYVTVKCTGAGASSSDIDVLVTSCWEF